MTEKQGEYIDAIVRADSTSGAIAVLEIVIRDTLPIRAALQAGQPKVALDLVEKFLKNAQETLEEI